MAGDLSKVGMSVIEQFVVSAIGEIRGSIQAHTAELVSLRTEMTELKSERQSCSLCSSCMGQRFTDVEGKMGYRDCVEKQETDDPTSGKRKGTIIFGSTEGKSHGFIGEEEKSSLRNEVNDKFW